MDIEDGPEQYARDILGSNSNESDLALPQRLAEVSGPVANFLADVARIYFNVGEFLFGHRDRRTHSWAEDKQSATSCGRRLKESLRFRSGSRPQCSLFSKKDGTVTGVVTDSGVLPAAKVILASGGYGASQELVSQYIPALVGVHFPGHHGSTG
jgi:hypothetical protein